jgi:hypothetical protein
VPNIPVLEMVSMSDAIKKMPKGPARDSAVAASRVGSAQRVYIGRSGDKTSVVVLSDAANHPRLRLTVDSVGAAGIEFLDATGKVTKRIAGE